MITHYSPYIVSYIINDFIDEDFDDEIYEKISLSDSVIIDYNKKFKNLEENTKKYFDLSSNGDPLEAANNLFNFLRLSEKVENCKIILLPNLKSIEKEHTDAVFDRIYRAASGKFINISKKFVYCNKEMEK
jgi:L-threonylcarbamoyladenylate synthase